MRVVLCNIRSLHNVGSIFRTADAAGIERIYLCGITPSPIDEFGEPRQQLAKVSLGAETYVPWEKVYSAARLMDKLKKEGFTILAVEQAPHSVPYHTVKLSSLAAQKAVLVMGNEIRGLSSAVLRRADKTLEIPMYGKKESLNIAVAFGIVAYHLLRNA